MKKFNEWLAEKLSNIIGNMYFFWCCVWLIIVALLFPQSTNFCQFISQTIIQLLALPVLALVSDIATNKIIKLLTDIWTWQKESHDEIKQMHQELHEKLDKLSEAKQ